MRSPCRVTPITYTISSLVFKVSSATHCRVFAAEFGEVQPRGQFNLRFSYGGATWMVRQISNAIRVIEGPVTFDMSGTLRENAAKVIIAAIKGLSQSDSL